MPIFGGKKESASSKAAPATQPQQTPSIASQSSRDFAFEDSGTGS